MAIGDVLEFTPLFPTEDEAAILARARAWANEGLDPEVDVDAWVDTREGSHWYVATMMWVREAAKMWDSIGTEVPASGFVLWAWGEYLDDHAEVQVIERLVSTPAEGRVTFTGTPGTAIPAGTTVGVEPVNPDDDAPEFETTVGGTIPAAASAPTGLVATHVSGGSLTNGTTYRYVVTAVDAAGETTASAEANAAGTSTLKTMDLVWDAVPTATSYRVYRKTGGAGPPWVFLTEVAAPHYSDSGVLSPGVANPPGVNTTGGKLTEPVVATEPGEFGNVGATAITQLSTPIPAVDVINAAATVGGTEPESDDALRERVLAAYLGKGAGNRRDYERWGRAWEGVGRVTVIPLWNGPGTVKVIALTIDGDPVSAETVAELQADLDPIAGLAEGKAPVGAQVTVTTATARPLDLEATIELESGYSLDGDAGTINVTPDIEAAESLYIESVEPGGEVVVSQVLGRITMVTGVHDARVDSLDGVGPAVNVEIDDSPAEAPQLGTLTLTEGTL